MSDDSYAVDPEAANIRERRFEVDSNFEGWRLDQFLANRIPRISRSFASKIIRDGDLTIMPPRRAKASMRLLLGDVVVLREHLEPEEVQDEEAGILYEDEVMLVLNKPAGMLVHESASVRLNTMTHYLQRQGYVDAEPVHRLDRETSGALVCAREHRWVAPLRGVFATDHPEKIYRVLVEDPRGMWTPGRVQTLDTPLGPCPLSRLSIKVGEGDLRAVTHVRALSRHVYRGYALSDLEVRIETGRQHQIRAHLAMDGTPVAGDKLYSRDDAFFMAICDAPDDVSLLAQLPFERQALHAWKIALKNPKTGALLKVEAPVPKMWFEVA
ncbi:RluA family pseudouridine synthase [Lujinxingia vulgaris]|uniref:RluA family pseudouridine synthase n=1 Tax=Lujinxingia vulgaris TaxID=2600176 RepID=A0A5C6XMS4_9DELT|nr:RluA family pseudouridine synthase [Lujinxingia vulgaris]TXD38902.1 RluA family pseudouridine synthase [Lujinxingia vulgaris]